MMKDLEKLTRMEDMDWGDFERWLDRIKCCKRVSAGWFAAQIVKRYASDPIEVKDIAIDLGLIEMQREGDDGFGNPQRLWVIIYPRAK